MPMRWLPVVLAYRVEEVSSGMEELLVEVYANNAAGRNGRREEDGTLRGHLSRFDGARGVRGVRIFGTAGSGSEEGYFRWTEVAEYVDEKEEHDADRADGWLPPAVAA